jgi:dTDP-4-dehydrorhamnose reductase
MLGDAFHKVFSSDYDLRCTDINITDPWVHYLDFRNHAAYRKDVVDFSPDYLFHLGAHTDLEYCELNVDDTYLTNTLSVENAVFIGNMLHIPIIYISTAGIFDGSKDTFDDWDIPNPLGHYARSKYAGETFVEKNAERYLIFRAGWMMGGGPAKDKKFVQKLMAQIKGGKKELFIVDDKLGTPTYTHDFAINAKRVLESELWGLYNMVCGGVTGRLEVARELLRIIKHDTDINIVPVASAFWEKEYFAARPASERLVNAKLKLRKMDMMRDWRLCLKEYIGESYSSYLGEEMSTTK